MQDNKLIVKNQHYVPVVHLKRFSDENREFLVQIVNRGNGDVQCITKNKPKSMGHKKNLYEKYSETPNQLENIFAGFEGRLGLAIDEVIRALSGPRKTKISVSVESIKVLSDHSLLLFHRHPSAINSRRTELASKIALQLPLNHDPRASVPLLFDALIKDAKVPSHVSIFVTRTHIPFNLSNPVLQNLSLDTVMPLTKNHIITFGEMVDQTSLPHSISVDVYYEQSLGSMSLAALNIATYNSQVPYPHQYVMSVSSSKDTFDEISKGRYYQEDEKPLIRMVRGNGFYVS